MVLVIPQSYENCISDNWYNSMFSIRFIRQIQFILKEVLKIRLLFLKSSVHFVFAFLFKLVNPNDAWRGANAHLTDVIHDVLVQ